mmetsp:Transcript_3323/g.8034  ORF Transcript_3323/g.8034 Transcript_3323/m.8034 type:complete len:545 (+) Transcript_3323:2-1636(+)
MDVDITMPGMPLNPLVRAAILQDPYYQQLQDDITGGVLPTVLPGPLQSSADLRTILREVAAAGLAGTSHRKWQEIQQKYCNGDPAANFVIPVVSFSFMNVRPPKITSLVVLADPHDCVRIARSHVKKMPDQANLLGFGVLSTTNNEDWQAQRQHLNEAFLPRQSLHAVCPVTVKRAQECIGKLEKLASQDDGVVQINEFLLNEAMAHLLLGLFGAPADFVEETNAKIRNAFSTSLELTGGFSGCADGHAVSPEQARETAEYVFSWADKVMSFAEDKKGPGEGSIDGPLSARIREVVKATKRKVPEAVQRFNAVTFAFAGHDTTAHTMTWLVYELCRRPHYQQRVQAEVDKMFNELDRPMCYDDMDKLPFLSRCITETLRLWPAVPNGTFRQLEQDDHVRGPDGKQVTLPKGTFVQIANWLRHRNPKLWGADVGEFNPEREWAPEEIWHGCPFSAKNPASESGRFSPFTFPPRDCIGRNFAQMEMRVVLSHLLHNYTFTLAEPTAGADPSQFMGINRGTMGPEDLRGGGNPKAPALGMHLKVQRR